MSSRASKNKKKRPKLPQNKQSIGSYVRARPWLVRQLEEAPSVMLFWRDGDAGSRTGMLCVTSFCGDPSCECRDAFLDVQAVPDNLAFVRLVGDHTELGFVPDPDSLANLRTQAKRGFAVNVNIDTGDRAPAGKRTVDEELMAWLGAELDADVLTHLRAGWGNSKGIGAARPAESVTP